MGSHWQTVSLVVLAVFAANLPFVNQRILVLGPQRSTKSLAVRLIELMVLYFVIGVLGLALEKQAGQIASQGWEFYAITATMFVTFAFPGFVFRYLMHRTH
ncbi:DUF2818 family protein [Limnohabitans sp. DM1]|uniref:DUF2818 family protein n=1 Tax=Limnohabitans sp. DM1 TaxID=1597955 RepID=UPI000A72B387|nr:DUF2818 family protein [Limnohabitans sp. DM1]